MIKEILVKSALHYHNSRFASNYDLNVYRGCEHRCEYCFAQYSHKYLESNFFNDIYVKTNIAEILDRELSKKTRKRDIINISGVCDCYQPLEEKYKLMPDILQILIKYRNPAFILTKSPLILRDYDLLEELSSKTAVCIATTVTTLDESIRQKIEPNTFSSMDRIKMLHEFTQLRCKTNVMFMPIIPYLTDSIKQMELLYRVCRGFNIDHLTPGVLHLRGDLKKYFYEFLENEFQNTFQKIKPLYHGSYASRQYTEKLHKFLKKMKSKYGLYSVSCEFENNDHNYSDQLDLFTKNTGLST
jgi:DNA repair photolyase